ncbi:MAG: MFS transporter, partial [Candidatus Kapaibacterium sp.]
LTFLVRDTKRGSTSVNMNAPKLVSSLSVSALRYWSVSPPAFRWALRPILLFAMFNSSDMFLLLYVTERHGGTTNALWAYIIYNLCLALSAYPLGWLSDRFSLRPVLASGILLVGGVYGVIPHVTSFTMVLAVFVVYGIGVAAFESTSKAWVSAVVPDQQIGSAMGFLAGTQSLALLFASTVTGLLWSTDIGVALTVTGVAAVSSAVWIGLRLGSLRTESEERTQVRSDRSA